MTQSEKNSEQRRRRNFSNAELFTLLHKVGHMKRLLLCELADVSTTKMKMKGWQVVTDAVNEVSPAQRNVLQVQNKFYQLRAIVKKKVATAKGLANGTGNPRFSAENFVTFLAIRLFSLYSWSCDPMVR